MADAVISRDTIKTFLLLFCVAGIGILSLNSYLVIQNQSKILDNQEKVAKPLAIENNQRIKNIEQMVISGNFSAEQVK